MVDEREIPDERAFSGHPDHPPVSPEQSEEANREVVEQAWSNSGDRDPEPGDDKPDPAG